MPWEPDKPFESRSEVLCKILGVFTPVILSLLYSFVQGFFKSPYGSALSVLSAFGVLLFQLLVTIPFHIALRDKQAEYLHWYLLGGILVPSLVWLIIGLISSQELQNLNYRELIYFGFLGMMATGVFGVFRIPFVNSQNE
jgi:hypothetical protein